MSAHRDTTRIELINGGAIEVDRLSGTIQTWENADGMEGMSTVVHPTLEEWAALKAAVDVALGVPVPPLAKPPSNDGMQTIRLAHDGDEVSVWPSEEVPGGIGLSLADSEEDLVSVGVASREEAMAIVAAVGKALAMVREAGPTRCSTCSEFGVRVSSDGCLTYLWGEEEEEQRLSPEISAVFAREILERRGQAGPMCIVMPAPAKEGP